MINILLVEDEESQIQMIKEAVETYCISNGCEINIDSIKNDLEIGNKLFDKKYDCIVIDINWGEENPDGGKKLINKIVNKKRIPLIVYAGNLSYVEDIEEQIGFKKFIRTTPFRTVLDEIKRIKDLKIFDLIGYSGELDAKITDIFWNDLEKSIKSIKNIPEYDDSNALVRMLTTRIVNKLNINEEGKQKYFEFYISPPVSDDVHNGDIYTIDGENYLVIMPECQIIHHLSEPVVMAHIDYEKINNKLEIVKRAGENKRANVLNDVLSLEKNPSGQFIPPFKDKGIGFINFANICTISREKLIKDNKYVSINPEYMKNIQARFSQYYSRQGQPDIDIEHLLNNLRLEEID